MSDRQIRRKPGGAPKKVTKASSDETEASSDVVVVASSSSSSSSSTSAQPAEQQQRFTHLIVLDFEAQCRDRPEPAPRPQEIVEFPLVVVDVATRTIVDEFHTYIKPTVHKQLFAFTTTLTGVTQAQVDAGIELDEALNRADEFIAKYNTDERSSCIVTCGHWDLRTALVAECKFKKFAIPRSLKRWCNVKLVFADTYRPDGKQLGMDGMLRELGLELVGRHHSGIDDARNIARIVIHLLKDGVAIEPNGTA